MQCSACKLSKTRRCITKGLGLVEDQPDVLFILESPTTSGEIFGKTLAHNELLFLGQLYRDAMRMTGLVIDENGSGPFQLYQRYWVISMVLCRATDELRGLGRPPEREEILACTPNVTKLVHKIQPKSVVFMSRLIEKFYKKEFPDAVYVMPPELLMKQGGSAAPYYSTAIRNLSQVLSKVQEERVQS